jgi:hypothetical protein
MLQRKVIWIVAAVIGLAVLASCNAPGPSVGIPPASQFQIPAVGTPMPGGHEEAVQSNLVSTQSGALIINQTALRIQVAVSNTIATLPAGQDFLFMLPPGVYEFYIYQPDIAPRVFKETLESGKLRYLYITRIGPGGG